MLVAAFAKSSTVETPSFVNTSCNTFLFTALSILSVFKIAFVNFDAMFSGSTAVALLRNVFARLFCTDFIVPCTASSATSTPASVKVFVIVFVVFSAIVSAAPFAAPFTAPDAPKDNHVVGSDTISAIISVAMLPVSQS